MACGAVVSPDGHVAHEDRHPAPDHVGLHHRRADIEQGHGVVAGGGCPQLELVLHGEGVEVDDRGLEPGRLDGRHVLAHPQTLDRHQEHVHGVDRLANHLIVDEDLVERVGDVVLGLEHDGVGSLAGGHLREQDALRDGLAARDGDDRGPGPDAGVLHALPDGVGNDPDVLDDPLDEGVPGQRHRGVRLEGKAATTGGTQLHRLDRARPDVQPERGHLPSPREGEIHGELRSV